MSPANTSRIEICRSAYLKNISFIRSRLKGKARISSVVKANAYGHGIDQIVPLAEEAGIDHFSVFSVFEARRVLRARTKKSDIMIMGWIDRRDLSWIIRNEIEFFVFDLELLNLAMDRARSLGGKIRIHIEVETGLFRTGFHPEELPEVIKMINRHRADVTVKGICTHFAGSESIANHVRVNHQFKRFNRIVQRFKERGIEPEYRHTACSASVINYPRTQLDMVRIGIMQYGYWPGTETRIRFMHRRELKTDPLERVITWKSQVMHVKRVPMGEYISYGNIYLAQEDKLIAVVPVGYAMGYRRSLSNYGIVLIRGHRANVIGLVNMNMLIIDVTLLPDVERGDEVVLIGRSGELEISVSSFADMSNMLNYESLTRLPTQIKRKVV